MRYGLGVNCVAATVGHDIQDLMILQEPVIPAGRWTRSIDARFHRVSKQLQAAQICAHWAESGSGRCRVSDSCLSAYLSDLTGDRFATQIVYHILVPVTTDRLLELSAAGKRM